jgi:hypothetical protein
MPKADIDKKYRMQEENTSEGIPGKASKIPPFLQGGQLNSMVNEKPMENALGILAEPGHTTLGLSMRTIIGKKNDGTILAKALAYTMQDNEEFGDLNDANGVTNMLALFVSNGGIGRDQVTQAITGERRHDEIKSGGIGGWLQKAAFGDKKD